MTAPDSAVKSMLPPPVERLTILGWAQKNLFRTWYDSLLTFLSIGLIYLIIRPFFTWLFLTARWEVIQVNLRLLMVGQYPLAEVWRIWLCLEVLATLVGFSWGIWLRGRRRLGIALLLVPVGFAFWPGLNPGARLNLVVLSIAGLAAFWFGRLGGPKLRRTAVIAWIMYFPFVILIIRGLTPLSGFFPVVPANLWGGLLLTFLLTVVGISFSFPLGVLLALGRRSRLPAVRWVSITYIEVVRGVPLVTILYMASTMVPLFLPGGENIHNVIRAMVGITLFSAAYMAENVRGGLQAIPQGQYEAAYALGLGGFQTMAYIILPQALRLVIPVLMGLFIALFKDTSLVATIGLLELLGISRSILAQPTFIGYQREVYLFISLIYWVFSYFMSYVSQRMEIALGVGSR
jgi:general L-amino acid transport system permease protein